MRIHTWLFGIVILCALIVSACQPLPPKTSSTEANQPTSSASISSASSSTTSTTAVQTKPPATTAPSTDVKTIWQTSPHANTHVVGADGNNNECARCHAPMNWLPTAMDEIPATCQSCKFKISTPKPVAKADWKSVNCEQCHKTEKEVVTKQVAWLNAMIAQFDTNADPYEAVKSNTELCEKCHRDAYKINMGTAAHKNLGCTDCHNAHSTKASCTDAKCHANALKPDKPIAGHDAAHTNVPCATCHDASGMKVAPTADKKAWLTYKPQDPRGKAGDYAVISHNLQRKVDCARCHSANNPWGLKPQ